LVQVRRGSADLDPGGFEILGSLDASGRSLLASDERVSNDHAVPDGHQPASGRS
jgi:hypothetical protein